MEEAVAEAVEQAVAEAEKLAAERAQKLGEERAQKLVAEIRTKERNTLIHRLLKKGFDIAAIADLLDENIRTIRKQAEGTAIV